MQVNSISSTTNVSVYIKSARDFLIILMVQSILKFDTHKPKISSRTACQFSKYDSLIIQTPTEHISAIILLSNNHYNQLKCSELIT